MNNNINITTKDGLKYILDLNNGIDVEVSKHGTYELHVKNIIDKYVKKEHICLDIGANFGVHAVRMGSKCKKVICIEPMPINERLKKNLELNNINYELFDCFVGDNDIDNIDVSFPNEFKVSGNEKRDIVVRNQRKIDTIIKDKINFIKLDVDGMEFEVLMGMIELIKRDKPVIITELCQYQLDPINGINCDPINMKNRWCNFVKTIIDIGYSIEYVAYSEYHKFNPKTPEDFKKYWQITTDNKFSSTDILFVPI
jgi:FkbM family methyltransferase